MLIWLNGTIASGKTTIGRLVARRLHARFLDGDDLAPAGVPAPARWRIATSRLLAEARKARPLVIAYPIDAATFARLRAIAPASRVITLAPPLRLTLQGRGRTLSDSEKARIREMRSKAHHRRPFAALTLPNATHPHRTAKLIADTAVAAARCPAPSAPTSPPTG